MAKYYVKCGRVRKVVERATREQAAFDVVDGAARSGDGRVHDLAGLEHLGLVTAVGERGFRDLGAQRYPTHLILCRAREFSRFDRGGEGG